MSDFTNKIFGKFIIRAIEEEEKRIKFYRELSEKEQMTEEEKKAIEKED